MCVWSAVGRCWTVVRWTADLCAVDCASDALVTAQSDNSCLECCPSYRGTRFVNGHYCSDIAIFLNTSVFATVAIDQLVQNGQFKTPANWAEASALCTKLYSKRLVNHSKYFKVPEFSQKISLSKNIWNGLQAVLITILCTKRLASAQFAGVLNWPFWTNWLIATVYVTMILLPFVLCVTNFLLKCRNNTVSYSVCTLLAVAA